MSQGYSDTLVHQLGSEVQSLQHAYIWCAEIHACIMTNMATAGMDADACLECNTSLKNCMHESRRNVDMGGVLVPVSP